MNIHGRAEVIGDARLSVRHFCFTCPDGSAESEDFELPVHLHFPVIVSNYREHNVNVVA